MCSSSLHFPTNDRILFFFMAEYYSTLYICHNFFVYSFINGHLSWFHALSIVNSAARNMGISHLFWVLISFPLDMYRVVVELDHSVSFLRNLHIIFHSGLLVHISPNVYKSSFFSMSLPTFVIIFFNHSHSSWSEMVSHCSLICISLIANDIEYFSYIY
jgi:hypothetical protein